MIVDIFEGQVLYRLEASTVCDVIFFWLGVALSSVQLGFLLFKKNSIDPRPLG
jgi:hypothetical protein